MILRHQLPVRSPLRLGALAAGLLPSRDAASKIEDLVRHDYGADAVRLTASGTVALALAIKASAPAGGSVRVALPAWGCYDLMTAANSVGATVSLYDLDPTTLSPDSASLADALQRAPHAVVVAHWFGIPVDLRELRLETERRGIVLIDDAAQGVGATVEGTPAGSLGDLGILSFGRGKGRTGGSGGALMGTTARGSELIGRLGAVPPGGSAIGPYLGLWAQWILGRPWIYGLPLQLPFLGLGETVYRKPPPLRGIADRSAAILERLWLDSARDAENRRLCSERWQSLLSRFDEIRFIRPGQRAQAGWLRCPILATGAAHHRLLRSSARAAGVARGYPLILSQLPVFRGEIANSGEEFVGARTLAASLFTLPTHRGVTARDFRTVEQLQRI